jgi:NifU-like protein involved in Fe-S cluster formation
MDAAEPYNKEVRTRFAKPIHAGDVQGEYDAIIEAEESASGASVRLAVGIDGGRIAAMRFRAWGCPHLIAAADALCAEAAGRSPADLAGWTCGPLAERLAVPRTKIGRLFLLEDALQSIVAQFEQSF